MRYSTYRLILHLGMAEIIGLIMFIVLGICCIAQVTLVDWLSIVCDFLVFMNLQFNYLTYCFRFNKNFQT
jgi:hypothetical protein